MRRSLAFAALMLGVAAAPAAAQVQPPSLTTDTRFAFAGVSEFDFAVGVVDDTAARAAVDPERDRAYAVGSTDASVAVIARRSDGSLDPSFAGDGSLEVPLGREANAVDVVVLDDGRLRVLARTDVATSGPEDFDTAIVGLLPDGSPDPAFCRHPQCLGTGRPRPGDLRDLRARPARVVARFAQGPAGVALIVGFGWRSARARRLGQALVIGGRGILG